MAADRARRGVPGPRFHHRAGAGQHPAGRRRARRHQDGPLRGRPAEPAHRQGLRGLHQQHRPRRQGRQGERHRGQPAQRQQGRPHRRDHRGPRRRPSTARSAWSLLLVCGDPRTNAGTYFAGYPKDKVSPISCPDNLAFDSGGQPVDRHRRRARAPSDSPTACSRSHSPAANAATSSSSWPCPRDAETCGPVIHDQDGLVFVAVQHPGEDGTFDDAALLLPRLRRRPVRHAPARAPGAGPRPSVVQVFRR